MDKKIYELADIIYKDLENEYMSEDERESLASELKKCFLMRRWS